MLPAGVRLGPVHLIVTDVERSISFYEEAIGLRLHGREFDVAMMGAGEEDLVLLFEDSGAQPAGEHAGLDHFALLHPSRLELARAAHRLRVTRTPVTAASDHGVSEGVYLVDPDGISIELAADRPRKQWGDLEDPSTIEPRPLDVDELLELLEDQPPRPQAGSDLVIGHVQLHVGDIEKGLRFYRDVLGFEPMTVSGTAAFVSAGGYHHHLAFNTWRGEDVRPLPARVVGLREWTVILEDEAQVDAIHRRLRGANVAVEEGPTGLLARDPWKNPVTFTPGTVTG